MSIFAKACSEALKEIPAINAVIDDEAQEIVYRDYVDISVAVACKKYSFSFFLYLFFLFLFFFIRPW